MKLKSTITKLDHAEYCGDWHDKPLRYAVQTGSEVQKFSTKKHALKYAAIRNRSESFQAAYNAYCLWEG